MFKSKRRKGSIRKVEKDDSEDSGVEIDMEMLKMEQKLRNEAKCGLSTEELLKSAKVEPMPLNDTEMEANISENPLDFVLKKNKEASINKEEEKLKEYLYDDALLYKPDGLNIKDINPKPIVSANDRKEIEETKDGHRETIEELIELKRKLTIDLKREKRLERERLGLL